MKIDSQAILYSKGSNDECITLDYAVEPLLKYIPKDKVIWCPFDLHDSNFVKLISQQNQVVYSHISLGQDFYTYEPKKWDIIISNPPFTNKRKIFERALSFRKPFALLSTATWFNDGSFAKLWKNKDLQILSFDKRMRFLNNGIINNKITFLCLYLCYNFLPKNIIFEHLEIK